MMVCILNLNFNVWDVEFVGIELEEETESSCEKECSADYIVSNSEHDSADADQALNFTEFKHANAQKSTDGHFEIDSPPPECLA
jgi:hypothetical protein